MEPDYKKFNLTFSSILRSRENFTKLVICSSVYDSLLFVARFSDISPSIAKLGENLTLPFGSRTLEKYSKCLWNWKWHHLDPLSSAQNKSVKYIKNTLFSKKALNVMLVFCTYYQWSSSSASLLYKEVKLKNILTIESIAIMAKLGERWIELKLFFLPK